MTIHPRSSAWPADRVAEARAVIADVAHHSDLLIRLACNVLVQHGETPGERADAQRLHGKGIPGKPDLVLPKYKAVIFVHGCFWHRH